MYNWYPKEKPQTLEKNKHLILYSRKLSEINELKVDITYLRKLTKSSQHHDIF